MTAEVLVFVGSDSIELQTVSFAVAASWRQRVGLRRRHATTFTELPFGGREGKQPPTAKDRSNGGLVSLLPKITHFFESCTSAKSSLAARWVCGTTAHSLGTRAKSSRARSTTWCKSSLVTPSRSRRTSRIGSAIRSSSLGSFHPRPIVTSCHACCSGRKLSRLPRQLPVRNGAIS